LGLRGVISRSIEKCAASHPGADPWREAWHAVYEWDLQQAGGNDSLESASDHDAVAQAEALEGAGEEQTAYETWKCLAEQGSVFAMLRMGHYHEYGLVGPISLQEADSWYKRASVSGSRIAMLYHAKFAARHKDFATSERVLKPGVEQGWIPAVFWTAWYRHKRSPVKDTYRAIAPMLREAERAGHPIAGLILANFMVKGKFGILKVPLGMMRVIKTAISHVNRGIHPGLVPVHVSGSSHPEKSHL
jgi:TPR repeat protein